MKLCMNEATCMKNSTLAQDLEFAEANGYEYIELRLDMLRDYFKKNSLQDLKYFFETSKVKPAGYNSIEDINFTTRDEWERIESDIRFACEVKQQIGGETLVVVPTIKAGLTYSKQEIFEDSVTVLKKIAAIAEPHGLNIAFEPIGSADCCVRSLHEAWTIVEAVDSESVGLVIDAFNLYLFDGWQDFYVLRTVPVEKIFCYHIDDSDNLPLQVLDHCHRLFPGNGVIPLKEITAILKNKGYDGICSLELFNPGYWMMKPDQLFEIGMKKTKPYL